MILHPPPVLAWYVVNRKDTDIHSGCCRALRTGPLSRFFHNTPLLKTLRLPFSELLFFKLFSFPHWGKKKMVMAWCSTVDRKRSRDYWGRSGLDGQPFSPASQSAMSSQCVTVCLWLTVCITHLSPFCLSVFVLYICIDFACFSFCSWVLFLF